MDEAKRLPRLYSAGVITHSELMCRLVCLAERRPPEEFGPLLPEWCLRELREESANPPALPEECPRVFAIESVANAQAGQRPPSGDLGDSQRAWYDGIRRWHSYLWPPPHAVPEGSGE